MAMGSGMIFTFISDFLMYTKHLYLYSLYYQVLCLLGMMFSRQTESTVAVYAFIIIYVSLYTSIIGPATFSHLMETSLNSKGTAICIALMLVVQALGLLLYRFIIMKTGFTATCVIINIVTILNIIYVKTNIKEWHYGYSIKEET